MTIFRKRPLTAVALGALFVGAISCGGDTTPPKTNDENGVKAEPCTISQNGTVLTCGGRNFTLTGKYQQLCFVQRTFDSASAPGLAVTHSAPMVENAQIVVFNEDGSTSAISPTQVVRAKNSSGALDAHSCFNFAVPKEGLLYQ